MPTRWGTVALIGLIVGCGSQDVVVVPASLEKVAAGDNQAAPAGALLPDPLAVIVRAADGAAAPRGAVRWSLTQGTGAVLSDSVTVADGNGRAEVGLRLGGTAGSYSVRAELVLAAQQAVAFTATATAPPTVSDVTPPQFGGGDTITITGSAFGMAPVVAIGGEPARVVSATDVAIRAIAPVCLGPGSVSVMVLVGGAPSNAVSATYSAPSGTVLLSVGDYAAIDPASVANCAAFPGAGSDSVEYLIAPQAVTGTAGDSVGYRLRGDSAGALTPAATAVPESLPFAVRFHDALRQREAGFARLPRPVMPSPLLAPQAAEITQGSTRSFRVCATLSCNADADFARVTAAVKYIGQHAVLYQDVEAPASGFSDADFQTLGGLFDTDLYEVDTQAFGAESDIDKNGLVIILFTPVVNGLTPKDECSQSFVTGFHFAIDLDPAFRNDSRSNQAEIFYSIVPDEQQTVTCQFAASQVRRIVPVTFIHEFQHMIDYYQHVLLRNGAMEQLWLNEAMSHLAEELGGRHFLALGDQQRFSDFTVGDLQNAFSYLTSPATRFTLFKAGTGTLEERGAAWLFLRWLVDQHGDGVTRRLEETSNTGAENVGAVTGTPIGVLLSQWFLANYVSDLPGFTAPAALTYTHWAFRTTFADLHHQAPGEFDRPFPLVPAVYPGGQFNVSGILRAGSGDYFRVIQQPAQRGFALQFTDAAGAALGDAVPARLNVIRIR